jgi:hypothetical protein
MVLLLNCSFSYKNGRQLLKVADRFYNSVFSVSIYTNKAFTC